MGVGDMKPACRFFYSACTVGVGAVLTSPDLAESWAPASLPIIGGISTSRAVDVDWPPPPADPVLHFDLAESTITGRQLVATPGLEEYETITRKKVTNLNILNRVVASIDVGMRFHYRRRPTPTGPPKQRDPIQVSFMPDPPVFTISVDGAPLAFTVNQQIPKDAGNDFHAFRPPGMGPGLIDAQRPSPALLRHEHGENGPGGHRHGFILTALAEPRASFLYQEPCEFGRKDAPDIPGLGRVYFYVAEWCGHPYRQNFTWLRVVLQDARDRVSPRGTFTGQIVIDEEPDGETGP